MQPRLTRGERRQAHMVQPLLRLARFARDLWVVAGALFLITSAPHALLAAIGVTP
jgi:hypothetical protein